MASLNWFSYSFFTFSPLLYSPTVYWRTNNYKYSALVCYSIDLASAIRGDTWLERKKGVLCFQYCQIFLLVQNNFFCFWPKRYARYNQNQIDREKRKNCNYFKLFTTGISQQEKQRSIWTDLNLGLLIAVLIFRKKSVCCLPRSLFSNVDGQGKKTRHPFGFGNNENDKYDCESDVRW